MLDRKRDRAYLMFLMGSLSVVALVLFFQGGNIFIDSLCNAQNRGTCWQLPLLLVASLVIPSAGLAVLSFFIGITLSVDINRRERDWKLIILVLIAVILCIDAAFDYVFGTSYSPELKAAAGLVVAASLVFMLAFSIRWFLVGRRQTTLNSR